MTAPEIVLVIAAVGAAIVSIIQSTKTHNAVNSRMDKFLAEQKVRTDELLKVGMDSAFQAGVKQATDTMKSVVGAAPLPAAPVPVIVVPDQPIPVLLSKSDPIPGENPVWPVKR